MTDLTDQVFTVGQVVRLAEEGEYYRMNTSHRYRLRETEEFEVTRVFGSSVNVRSVNTIYNRWSGRNERMSFSFSNVQIVPEDPNTPRPRKLGEKPEGDEFIGLDHPGIQWLFDDMGKYADKQGWCPQYDTLCIRLGIPGRPRDFSVKAKFGDIEVTSTIKARSQREANEAFEAALAATPTLATVA